MNEVLIAGFEQQPEHEASAFENGGDFKLDIWPRGNIFGHMSGAKLDPAQVEKGRLREVEHMNK